MTKYTLNILWCEHRRIFKVCLAVLQHHEMKGIESNKFFLKVTFSAFLFQYRSNQKVETNWYFYEIWLLYRRKYSRMDQVKFGRQPLKNIFCIVLFCRYDKAQWTEFLIQHVWGQLQSTSKVRATCAGRSKLSIPLRIWILIER